MIIAIGVTSHSSETIKHPIEVGEVRRPRGFDAALNNGAKTGKPVLVLFRESPGCTGVQKFGREVLTDPLIVGAMEKEFCLILDSLANPVAPRSGISAALQQALRGMRSLNRFMPGDYS